MPIGKYILKQIEAGKGFVKNKEEIEIEIKGKAQEEPVNFYEYTIENKRQKLDIEIESIDKDTKEKLEGDTFGIYAKEDIVRKDGTIIVEKGTLIEKVTSNKEGKVIFNKEMPLGSYEIKQEEPPVGYIHQERIIEVEGRYKEDQRKKIEIKETYENEKMGVYVDKINRKKERLEGAKVQIEDEKGNIVEEFTTGKEKYRTKNLRVEKGYKLVEKEPAKGYVTAKEI